MCPLIRLWGFYVSYSVLPGSDFDRASVSLNSYTEQRISLDIFFLYSVVEMEQAYARQKFFFSTALQGAGAAQGVGLVNLYHLVFLATHNFLYLDVFFLQS